MPDLSVQDALEIALAHQNAGRLDEAETIYRQVLSLDPNHAVALHLLGVLTLQRKRADVALQLIARAAAIEPQNPEFHNSLGNVLHALGRLDEAAGALQRAIRLRPDYAAAYSNLGDVFRELKRDDAAIECLQHAIALDGEMMEAHYNLANALRAQGRLREAIESIQNALQLCPERAEIHTNLAIALVETGRVEEALNHYDRAIALQPDLALARWNRALALLLSGDFPRGLADYEWRWRRADAPPNRHSSRSQWLGGDAEGKTILLHAEQGLGDTLQFIRYAPLVAARGARVLVECQPPLKRLLKSNLPFDVFSQNDALPECELQCPMLSLPLAFSTTLQTIPAPVSYLRADPDLSHHWEDKMPRISSKIQVGICWGGNPSSPYDRNRSITPALLAPLGDMSNLNLFSLTKTPPPHPAASAKLPNLIDLTPELTDFADTAALIDNLDLVISVDTAVAHLAAAMGKPTWLLLPHVPDWRWMLQRGDSPWYPTMTLFRQPARGDWRGAIRLLLESLPRFIER